jgi:tetratricopeptide (TPR) repeat protein
VASASAAPAPSALAARGRDTDSAKPKELTAAEKREAAAYLAALGRGRKATVDKRWADAIAGFDAALKIRPKDARARCERGFAKLLSEDLVGARADLTAARDLAHDPIVLSQILHNLGRIEKAEGRLELAEGLFSRAKKLAAAARQGSKNDCPVETTAKRESGKVLDSWKAVLAEAKAAFERESSEALRNMPPADATDDAIIRYLAREKPPAKNAWQITVENDGVTTWWGLVIARADGKLLLFDDIGQKRVSRCGDGDQGVSATADGSVLSVTVDAHFSNYAFMCEGPKGESKPCHEAPDDSYKPVMSYCEAAQYGFRTTFYDLASGERTLTLVEEGSEEKQQVNEPRVTFELQKDAIQLAGAGCTGRVEFAK